ncbi:pilus assembly protein PilY [Verminephrobacter eiseniae]|nr:pilus assembly protein PilY [Verminephrobacter eiseniae]MCW5302767.1 pilus assembly protein PilY [Verminephrobacter eiseniae]MCW8181042.1 pilus assembly protein PilY [Verminephrobacter eiseniae]MCW8190786.1 pilus assembly protein PilY [Verminephrobacter eiseniae]
MREKSVAIHHLLQQAVKISAAIKPGLLLAAMAGSMMLSAASADVDVSRPENAIPPNIVSAASKPMVMLTASKDHLLFGPIYNDFEDIDGDDVIDTTFKPTFLYYGYFDASKCYAYDNNAGQFNPAAMATQTAVTVGTVTAIKYSCSPQVSHWSGNFLNWATMTRLDTVRKMLYGGYRQQDSSGSTVLMGSRLVLDAHSFVKYYRGTDIRDYTPFSEGSLVKTTGNNAGVYAGLSICVTGTSENPGTSQPIMRLVKGNVRFWSTVELLVCRWRDAPDNYKTGTFGPKLAQFYLQPGGGGVRHETSIPSRTLDGATYSGIGPDLNVRVKVCDPAILGAERCQAFPSGLKPFGLLQEFGYPKAHGEAARAEFGLITGSYDRKNTAGALRKNMRDLEDEINHDTGVFCHSASSGCPAVPLDNNQTIAPGVIKTFDAIVLYGRMQDHTYGSGWGASVAPSNSGETQLPAWGNPMGEMLIQALQYYAYDGSTPTPTNPSSRTADSSVGMPVANWSDPFTDSETRRAKYGNAVCRPLNILALSSSTLSFDGQGVVPFGTLPDSAAGLDSFVDKIGDAEGISNTVRSVGSVAGKNMTAATDKNSCAAKTVTRLSDVNGICPEAPAMGGTYQMAGAALYGNTTQIRHLTRPPADLATVENALKIKTMAVSLSGGAPRIDVLVPGSVPPKYVYITPESVFARGQVGSPMTFASISSGPTHGAFMVTWNDILMGGDHDMDITGFIRYDLSKNENSPSGWDISILTDITNVAGGGSGTHGFSIIGVQNPDGRSGNGRYLTHQHIGGLLTGISPESDYLCGQPSYRNRTLPGSSSRYSETVCSVSGDGSTGDPNNPHLHPYFTVQNREFIVRHTFNMVGEKNALIKDPLWYAGKYGSFKSGVKNPDGTYQTLAMPSTQDTWDSIKTDGSIGQDDIPDGYFLGRRPELLEAYLRNALNVLAKNTNAVPTIAAAQLSSAEHKFMARFDSTAVTGELEAYEVDSSGKFSATPAWKAGALLQARTDVANSREIITNNGNGPAAGVKFRWTSLPEDYKNKMTAQSKNRLSGTNAKLALEYIRGDQSREGFNGLRQRVGSLLGPVVNATPWVQGRPDATLAGLRSDDGYVTFFKNHKDRAKLLWVAANDGMLHAFNPDTGAEVFAYVPGALANRLAEIPLQRGSNAAGRTKLAGKDFVTGAENLPPHGTVWPYVDGNPFSADVKVGIAAGTAWKTYVFGTLGRGGKGVFALDATRIADLTEDNAANVFKWQFTAADDPDLGYITGEVSIHATSNQALPVAKMNNGKYALLLGNGYKSESGKAVLYVLFVDGPGGNGWTPGRDGSYLKIVADAGPGNGLSMPRWEDIDGDGTADVAYAGDLKGNIWKFNLQHRTNPTMWQVDPQDGSASFGPGNASSVGRTWPLHNAGHPITTAPQLMHMGQGGLMVNFATGNAFGDADFPRVGVTQRVYGIWDRRSVAGAPPFAQTRTIDANTLVRRTYTRNAEGVVTVAADTPALDWSAHNGWYIDLPGPGEAVLSDPFLDAGVLSFVTVRPREVVTGESAPCFSNHRTAFYTVDPIAGKAERDLQGSIMLNSTKVLVTARDIGDQKVRLVIDKTKKAFTKACQAGEAGCTCTEGTCTKAATCGPGQRARRIVGSSADATICVSTVPRLQWREIPGLRTDQ